MENFNSKKEQVTACHLYCIAGNFHQEEILPVSCHLLLLAKFLSCVNENFTTLAKIYSTEYFCSTKVARLGKLFIQQKFSAIQYFKYIVHNIM